MSLPSMKVVSACQAYIRGSVDAFYRHPGRSLDSISDFSRRYFFTLAFLSLFFAKFLHLYAHLRSLPAQKVLSWGATFFFQDVVILLLLRMFAQRFKSRPFAALAALFLILFG